MEIDVAQNIRAIRKARGLTIRQVAEVADYDAGNLSKIERNKVGWSLATLQSLAPALNCQVRDFFLSEEERRVLRLWETMDAAERAIFLRLAAPPAVEPRVVMRVSDLDDDSAGPLASAPALRNRTPVELAPTARISRRHRPLGAGHVHQIKKG